VMLPGSILERSRIDEEEELNAKTRRRNGAGKNQGCTCRDQGFAIEGGLEFTMIKLTAVREDLVMNIRMLRFGLLFLVVLAGGIVARLAFAEDKAGDAEKTPAGMVVPHYDEEGKLLAPENYRNWVFVGASVGLSYNEEVKSEASGPGLFHHTYMQPEAYARYCETGKFPEKTMLILELYVPAQKVDPNKGGYFQNSRVAVEVALKDHEHFEEGWAYFGLPMKDKKPTGSAKANPKGTCFACHAAHAAEDNVFTQFYPVLREAKEARAALAGSGEKAPAN